MLSRPCNMCDEPHSKSPEDAARVKAGCVVFRKQQSPSASIVILRTCSFCARLTQVFERHSRLPYTQATLPVAQGSTFDSASCGADSAASAKAPSPGLSRRRNSALDEASKLNCDWRAPDLRYFSIQVPEKVVLGILPYHGCPNCCSHTSC